jgi:succinyl-diaminopimelate desuccinylase
MAHTLLPQISEDRDKLIGFVQSLVRFETINPPGDHYLPTCDFLAARLRDLDLKTSIHRVPDREIKENRPDLAGHPRANVLARWDTGATRTIHFNAHIDVVPVSGNWKHGPFDAVVDGDWMFGRGTADMKGAIGSLFQVLLAYRQLNRNPPVNIEISLTADEETDSEFGAAWIVDKGLVNADWAVVCEGGSGLNIGCGHNGVVWLEVTVLGRSAHGAHPENGVNAVEKMSRLVTALERYQKRLERITFVAPDGTQRRATINVGGVAGTAPGGKINTVPGSASFTIDRRVLPNEDLNQAEQDLRDFISRTEEKVPGLQTEVRRISRHPSTFLSPDQALPTLFARSVSAVRRRKPGFSVSAGFNDSHFFAQVAGLPTLGYGPGGHDYHGADERVSIRELLTTARVYAHFIEHAGEQG